MDRETLWEEAWRAFDVDLQADHDSQALTNAPVGGQDIFEEIADEFEVESLEDVPETIPAYDCLYHQGWCKLGEWLSQNPDASALDIARAYNNITDTLGLHDDGWSPLRKNARKTVA